MAIGDSLYQGVRSLSFTSVLGRLSPPAQVAAALGQKLQTPNPGVPILFDLEQMIRGGGAIHLAAMARTVALANAQVWTAGDQWSQFSAFDNIAVGGAEIDSLHTDTYAVYWPKIPGLVQRITAQALPDLKAIWDLWYALNVCFTLNPQQRDDQAQASQIEQVLRRQPRTVLVNIGSNEGLFDAGFLGNLSDDIFKSIKAIPDKMAVVGERLAALPPDTVIAVNSLVRPRCAANLMPSPETMTHYPGDGYFAAYGARLVSTQQPITGARLKAFDEAVQEVNGSVEARLRGQLGDRLRWVDLYAATTQYDGKHYADRTVPVLHDGSLQSLRNVPLFALFGHRFGGGLAGLDNMHPSGVGYAKIADAVLAALGATVSTDKATAFAADTLLMAVPGDLTFVQMELPAIASVATFLAGAA
jgi:hypothetical protein